MLLLGMKAAAFAVLRNFAHRLLRGPTRGGHRSADWDAAARRRHAERIYDTVAPHLETRDGRDVVGLEVGPGDTLGVCSLCLERGMASRMYAVERFAHPASAPGVTVVTDEVERIRLPEPVDFALSNDVFEHVRDVPAAFRSVYAALRPGGRFVSSIDLRGHNAFKNPARPLDFLTCPDWLWRAMFSHVVTTNRVRRSGLASAARAAGFEVMEDRALAVTRPEYLRENRQHMLPRYRSLPDDDLSCLQLLLVLRRPTGSGTGTGNGRGEIAD